MGEARHLTGAPISAASASSVHPPPAPARLLPMLPLLTHYAYVNTFMVQQTKFTKDLPFFWCVPSHGFRKNTLHPSPPPLKSRTKQKHGTDQTKPSLTQPFPEPGL